MTEMILQIIAGAMFILASVNCGFISYMFYNSVNGMLRKVSLTVFAALSFAFFIRGLAYLHIVDFNGWINIIVLLPVLATTAWKARYLLQTYLLEKETDEN